MKQAIRRKLKQWKWGVAAFFALAVVLVFAVRWLTPTPFPEATDINDAQSLQAAWADAISKYGLDPVFPPEEDLTVGDVLAVVVEDADNDPNMQKEKVRPGSPFLKRSVKIAHIDVREDLEKTYAKLPVFAPSDARRANQDNTASTQSNVVRLFRHAVRERDLPRAAFSRLRIQASNRAAAGLAVGSNASANYGASNEGLEELRLAEVSTYGLPAARALAMLTAYCTADDTRNNCSEEAARNYLRPAVGARIDDRYARTDQTGGTRYVHAIKVAVVIVNRVYLTRSIEHLRRIGSSDQGSAILKWMFGNSGTAGHNVLQEPIKQSGVSTSGAAGVSSLGKRLAEVEKELTELHSGGTFQRETSFGSEILMNEKLDRPVAFAYRGVRFRFPELQ